VRSRGIVAALALILAVAALGGGTAFAQTPVAPAPTVAADPDGASAVDPKEGEEKAETPKAEEPKAEEPKVEEAKAEKAEKPKVEKPKPQKPKVAKPKSSHSKPKAAKPKPAKPTHSKPKPKKPKPEKPRPAKPTPHPATPAQPQLEKPKPTQPKPTRARAGTPRAEPSDPRQGSQVDDAEVASPKLTAAPSRPGAAIPERSETNSAGSGGDLADAAPVVSGTDAATSRRGPHRADDRVAAAAANSLDSPRPGVLPVEAPAGYNVTLLLLTMLFAVVYPVGVRRLFRREIRRGLGSAAWRRRQLLRTAAVRLRSPPRARRRRSTIRVFRPEGLLPDANRIVRQFLRAHLDLTREYAMAKERGLARGFTDRRGYSHGRGTHLVSIRRAAYNWARRFRAR
jgi:hypothetical protein